MCGLAGIHRKTGILDLERLSSAVETLKHRGPDGHAIWRSTCKRVALLHTRLSIIDLTATGDQPMMSSDRRFTLVFNGEIYNYHELRALLKSPEALRGSSDTEVFLSLISERGILEALKLANGMFAFALWDHEDGKLVLARDRVGEKPLYYRREGEHLIFASELNAIRAMALGHLSHDEEAISLYLSFGFIPSPKTIFKGVLEVPTGSYMEFSEVMDGKFTQFWSLEGDAALKSAISFDDACEQTWELLNASTRIRLRSDVPVGCFLSGGIDSGLIVASATEHITGIKTFTASIPESPRADESALAKLTANQFGTSHIELPINYDVQSDLPKIVNSFGQPLADPSCVPTYYLMKEARKHVKVVLNGEGADELFCGYRRSSAYMLQTQIPRLLKIAARAVKYLPVPSKYRSGYAFLHRLLAGLGASQSTRYLLWCQDGFQEGEINDLLLGLGSRASESAGNYLTRRFSSFTTMDEAQKFLMLDFEMNMHDDMLKKLDICSMAHGIEARSPFLDPKLVEYAFSLPLGLKASWVGNKPILRAIARRRLPKQVAAASKRGFEIPIHDWLRGPLSSFAREAILSESSITMKLFSRAKVIKLLEAPEGLSIDQWSRRIWSLLCLSLWK